MHLLGVKGYLECKGSRMPWLGKVPKHWNSFVEYISCEPNHAYQNAYQACTFGATLVLRWSTISFISLYSTIINPYATRTYKRQIRTENPCVGGSNPLLPITLTDWLPSTYACSLFRMSRRNAHLRHFCVAHFFAPPGFHSQPDWRRPCLPAGQSDSISWS